MKKNDLRFINYGSLFPVIWERKLSLDWFIPQVTVEIWSKYYRFNCFTLIHEERKEFVYTSFI